VQTEIIDFSEDVIKDAINEEIERGGQVFFVHNRVEDIYAVQQMINRICPQVKDCCWSWSNGTKGAGTHNAGIYQGRL
jgi:transcription-repair coupling factor (superfamily II helicase)